MVEFQKVLQFLAGRPMKYTISAATIIKCIMVLEGKSEDESADTAVTGAPCKSCGHCDDEEDYNL